MVVVRKSSLKYFLFLFGFLFLIGCQDIEYVSIDEDLSIPSLDDGNIFRNGVKNFTDNMSSDKLDLVIILDTQKGMESFYKKNIFGSDFLNHFEEFDWRVAYTNTSISPSFFESPEKEEVAKDKGKKKQICKGNLSRGLTSGLAGALLSSPYLLVSGVTSLIECVTSPRNKKKKNIVVQEANGDFLQFEHKKKRIKLNGNYLTKDIQDYNSIFQDTMTFGENKKKSNYYDAPVIQGVDSTPLLSALFSFSKKITKQEEDKFFREDSRIVYVVITPVDKKVDLKSHEFKAAIEHSLDGKSRFQLIPVTIQKKNIVCKLKFQEMGLKKPVPAIELQKFSENSDAKFLDICSPKLGEELAVEIKTHLHSTKVL